MKKRIKKELEGLERLKTRKKIEKLKKQETIVNITKELFIIPNEILQLIKQAKEKKIL